MIHIVDYGTGNLASIRNMLKRIGVDSVITADPAALKDATKIILPGVGSFDEAMRTLRARGFIPVLEQRVRSEHVPLLGVCLGMQLLGQGSEEGQEPGLGWLPMRFRRFAPVSEGKRVKTIHMGWNLANPARASALFPDSDQTQRFYFVHGYHAVCDDEHDVLATTDYGGKFPSVVRRDNIYGAQFHPEKSHRYGMRLLKNFVERA